MTQRPLEFVISGMHCASCSARIERVLGAMPEVEEATVSLADNTGRILLKEGADEEAAAGDIIQHIDRLGFSAKRLGAGDPAKLEFSVGGMHCAACSSRIERVLGAMPEVERVSVSLAANTAQVRLAPEAARAAAADAAAREHLIRIITDKVAGLGFSADLLGGDSSALSEAARRWEDNRAAQERELKERRRDLIPAFCFALPLLVLSMGEMLGLPLPDALSPAANPLRFALAQLFLCLPVIWSGRRFYQQGIPALFRRVPNMDTLVALGTGAAFFYSLWNTCILALSGAGFLSAFAPGATGQGVPFHGDAQSVPLGEGFWEAFFGADHAMHGVELYYESAAVVIALVSLGKYLEVRSRMRTSEAMKGLLDLAPETAARLVSVASASFPPEAEQPCGSSQEGEAPCAWSPPGLSTPLIAQSFEEVPLARVQKGDVLLIRPGGRVPVDGVALEGASFVDESMLTGESMPVEKGPGDALAGGTMNQRGALVMRAERVGADTVLARIVHLVQEAQGSKAPIAGLADRVSLYFVPAVMVIACLAGLFWWLHGDSGAFAVRIFVSVMVIACPCAMGLATPMAIMVGAGRGAQLGVLFKNGQALELTSRITTMVLDKTGTLTQGRPALMEVLLLDGETPAGEVSGDKGPAGKSALGKYLDADKSRFLRLTASLEASSEHPLALALLEGAKEAGLTLWPVKGFAAVPGKGVSGTVHTPEGPIRAAAGNALFARELMALEAAASLPAADSLDALLAAQTALARTPVILLVEGAPLAVFAVADPLREESAGVVARLESMGITSVMLTGDNEATAKAVAAQAGITDVIAGVLPEGKEQAVAALRAEGRVVGMVGDGVNDAPALARADVGIAVGSGIDVAVETGDVVLMSRGLTALPIALALGRATMRTIRENLFWAFAYNIIGIPFAAGVFHYFGGPTLSPMLAGAAMALSSVSVVVNSLRLRLFMVKPINSAVTRAD